MNKKILLKILIDIIMCILFILEINLNLTGINIHEVIGLITGLIILFHLSLNFLWIKLTFKKGKLLNNIVLINILLFISVFIMLITGIIISRYIFSFNIDRVTLIYKIHKISSYISGIFIIIHILFHYKYLKNSFINIFKNNKVSIGKKILFIFNIILLGSIFIYTINNMFNKKINIKENISHEINKDNNYNEFIDEDNKIEDDNLKNDGLKPTLDEYLKKLHCNGCGRRCSLLNPKCHTGKYKAEEAKNEYYSIYS